MRLVDRLRSIINSVPSNGSVTFPIQSLVEWLDEEVVSDSGGDVDVCLDLSVADAARALRRSQSTVRGWCAAGLIPDSYRLRGREWRIPRPALQGFLVEERRRASMSKQLGRGPRRPVAL